METNDRVRQVVAVLVGLIVIIVLVLVARWTGDRIREKFLAPVKAPALTQTIAPVQPVKPFDSAQGKPVETVAPTVKGTTATTIPATGPADFGYYILGFIFTAGLLAKKYASI